MRIGIDLGGTKTEIIVLDDDGAERYRKRIATDRESYEAIVNNIAGLVRDAEEAVQQACTVGVGLPGTISARTGMMKNANTTVLNGHPIDRDLGRLLNREVRCMNDANCFALSEAVDGAAAGKHVVFGVIIGTGCGGGLVIGGKCHAGPNLVAGEWGHNPLPWMTGDEYPGPSCWCGKQSCLEKWISGTGFCDDYARLANLAPDQRLKGHEIEQRAREGDRLARQALERYADRLARALAHVINMVDPDVIVLGGGMSKTPELYDMAPPLLSRYVFGGEADTPVLPNVHGDSSGVRGAAWLWD